ncbi:MAG TPA: DUF4166 domain-containing protein, partial [Caulobacteraceae bacterium]|nr:DUF4166 domain-containing protein [Caulobacteraceae bacterium]
MSVAGHLWDRPARQAREPTLDFRALLGEAAWGALPAAVQARFASHVGARTYPGSMTVRASAFGWLIAQACRLIGMPLAPWTGEAVPVSVTVWVDAAGALVWDRTYAFAARPPMLITSRKLVSR